MNLDVGLASVNRDHYNDEAQRHKKLLVWLIGGLPIALITFLFCSLMPLKFLMSPQLRN